MRVGKWRSECLSDYFDILINTGLAVDSTQHIQDNIEALGFDFQDIKILLTMEESLGPHRCHG